MTSDQGYIRCCFRGDPAALAGLDRLVAETDRQNQFSHGLSWLDELDFDREAECELVSFDTMEATREFLSGLLLSVPGITFEGELEHSWPTLPCRTTRVAFSVERGVLRWEETVELTAVPEAERWEDDDEDWEPEYPTEP